jgi:hypothetical protein
VRDVGETEDVPEMGSISPNSSPKAVKAAVSACSIRPIINTLELIN